MEKKHFYMADASAGKYMTRVKISEIDRFFPTYKDNPIFFCFRKEELIPETGEKIIGFLKKLEKQGVKYHVINESLPRCIFYPKNIKSFRDFRIEKRKILARCNGCIYLRRKECEGINEFPETGTNTIFDALSIHDILSLSRIVKYEDLNPIIDEMFKVKTVNTDEIFWDYPENVTQCDYDFIFHYVECKMRFKRQKEMSKNYKLRSMVLNAYEKRKKEYLDKKSLVPRDNRWTKLIIILNWLGLNPEKDVWIKKFATYRYSEDEPKMPQAWNRVWAFTKGLDIRNINDLKMAKNINFSESKKIINSYVPKLNDVFEQNVFNESRHIMLSKYVAIRKFSNMPLFREIRIH